MSTIRHCKQTKTRLQRFTTALPKILLLLLLTGMAECDGCDDIGLLLVTNADTMCIGAVIENTENGLAQRVFPGDLISFVLPKGETPFRFLLVSYFETRDGEPIGGCPCLASDIEGRFFAEIQPDVAAELGASHVGFVIGAFDISIDSETDIDFRCNPSKCAQDEKQCVDISYK